MRMHRLPAVVAGNRTAWTGGAQLVVVKGNRLLSRGAVGSAVLAFLASAAQAQAADPADEQARLDALRQKVEAQTRQLEALKRSLAEQEASLAEMRRALGDSSLSKLRAGTGAPGGAQPTVQPPVPTAPAAVQPQTTAAAGPAGNRPEVAPIFEQPGVLTPPGKFVFEPSLQYAYSSSNRIALVGYTVIPAILIGLIDVREIRRTTLTGSLTGRLGVTNRFELEAKVPYVYRSDNAVGREFLSDTFESGVFDTKGKGLGDVELTARYQLNAGGADSPYYIGSLRFKSRTGTDPFEVLTTRNVEGFRGSGIETELPTGSGFYSLQPALTVLYPSDPAVFFGTVSYLHSLSRNNVTRNTDTGPELLGKVQPGGIIGFNFGMGIGLNDRTSFSLGYDHASVGKTKINGQTGTAVRVQLGTLLLGYSLKLDSQRTLNVSLGAGLTRDTPDLSLTVRMPFSF